jgi:hypothetical protein
MNQRDTELLLSFDPQVLEPCFLIAEILDAEFDEPAMEYGLLGLADERAPFHVLATPLLIGQSVTPSKVEQPGRQVLRMRDEVDALSRQMQRRLVPISFIHRHNRSCDASITDHVFLRGVFIDQVSTVVSFDEVRRIDATDPPCACSEMRSLFGRASADGDELVELRGEYGVAFSLIVNRMREHAVYAVRKTTCPLCGRSEVRGVPARITPDPSCLVSAPDNAAMRSQLIREIEAKIRFAPTPEVMGALPR